jgi:signal recognition particle receptor subunit beta
MVYCYWLVENSRCLIPDDWQFTLHVDNILLLADKMISSNCLNGVPLLVLANKQDIPDCMGVREVKPIFNQSAHLIGRRDCMVMPVSALTGYGKIF